MSNSAAYQKRYYERRKAKAIALLGGTCARCGTTEDLQFDHRDHTVKNHHVTGLLMGSWARVDHELRLCQLLCRPCHLDKTRDEGSLAKGKESAGIVHGTEWAYKKWRCRCELCRAAKRDARLRRASHRGE